MPVSDIPTVVEHAYRTQENVETMSNPWKSPQQDSDNTPTSKLPLLRMILVTVVTGLTGEALFGWTPYAGVAFGLFGLVGFLASLLWALWNEPG